MEMTMLKITMYVEEVEMVEESVYDEDGFFYDAEEDVWYCIDEEGTEYWYDEESEDWVECEYEEDFIEDIDPFDDFCYYEE